MLYFRCSKYGIYFSALHKVKPKSSGNLNRLMNQFIHKVIQCFLEPIKHFQQFSKIIPAGNILFPINVFCSFFEEIILHFFKLLCSTFHILFLFVCFFLHTLYLYFMLFDVQFQPRHHLFIIEGFINNCFGKIR